MVAFGLAGATPQAAWFLAAVVVAASLLQRVSSSVLNGLQKWRAASIVGVVMAVVAAGTTVIVLAAGGGISRAFLAVEAGVTLRQPRLALVAVAGRRSFAGRCGAGTTRRCARDFLNYALVDDARRHTSRSFVWRRSKLSSSLSEPLLERQGDCLGSITVPPSPAVHGAYLLIPQAIVGVLLPAVATLLGAGATDRIRQGLRARDQELLLVLMLPMTAVAIALGPLTLRLLYGEDFRGVGPVLVMLLIPLPIVTLLNLSAVRAAWDGEAGLPTRNRRHRCGSQHRARLRA